MLDKSIVESIDSQLNINALLIKGFSANARISEKKMQNKIFNSNSSSRIVRYSIYSMNFNNFFEKKKKYEKIVFHIFFFFFCFTSNNLLSIIPITRIGNFPICFITRFFRKPKMKEKKFSSSI